MKLRAVSVVLLLSFVPSCSPDRDVDGSNSISNSSSDDPPKAEIVFPPKKVSADLRSILAPTDAETEYGLLHLTYKGEQRPVGGKWTPIEGRWVVTGGKLRSTLAKHTEDLAITGWTFLDNLDGTKSDSKWCYTSSQGGLIIDRRVFLQLARLNRDNAVQTEFEMGVIDAEHLMLRIKEPAHHSIAFSWELGSFFPYVACIGVRIRLEDGTVVERTKEGWFAAGKRVDIAD